MARKLLQMVKANAKRRAAERDRLEEEARKRRKQPLNTKQLKG